MQEPMGWEKLPEAVRPFFVTTALNADVELYSGPMTLLPPGATGLASRGRVVLSWSAQVLITFEIERGLVSPESRLTLLDLGASANVVVQRHGGGHVRGVVRWSFEVGPNIPVQRAVFHLPNFPLIAGTPIQEPSQPNDRGGFRASRRDGRTVFEVDGWKVQLDLVENYADVAEDIKWRHGFAFTHVGVIERVDGSGFTRDQADDFITLLWHALSFIRGGWSYPMLTVGLGGGGEKVWQLWGAGRTSPGEPIMGAIDPIHAECVQGVLECFASRWKDEEWQKAISWATMFYVEAHKTLEIEVSTVLAQSAMELLSSIWISRYRDRLARGKPPTSSAPEKITRVLEDCNVDTSIPARFPDLIKAAQEEGWENGPRAIAEIRNHMVHGSKATIETLASTPGDARGDAWLLAHWYLDLLFLRVLGYGGSYTNRLRTGSWLRGATDQLPWTPKP